MVIRGHHPNLAATHQGCPERIDPVEKTLACGDTGIGAMASPKTILRAVCAFPRRAWWILQRRVVS